MMKLVPTWTKAGSWTLGRDPLEMQATSVRFYRSLVYKEERLTVRKRGGRKRALGSRAPMAIPQDRNLR